MNPNITKLRSRCEPPRCDFDGLQNSTIRVLSRCRRRPYFSSRFASTTSTRLASSSCSTPVRRRRRTALKRPSPKPWLHFVLEPLVQHLVQIDVTQRRGNHTPLRGPPLRIAQLARLHHPGVQPLPYRTSYHSVLHPSVQKAPQDDPNPRCRRSPRCPGLSPSHHRTPSALPTVTAALGVVRHFVPLEPHGI